MIDLGLIIAYILLGLAMLGAVVFPLMYMLKHPKESKMTFLGILALVVIFLIGWIISGSEVTETYSKFNISGSQSKLIGGSLIASYIIGFLAIVFTVGSQIIIAIRKR